MLTVDSIVVYPVKSCVGVEVSKAAVSKTGLLFDRRWMVVRIGQEGKGRLMSLRNAPNLSKVTPHLPPGAVAGEAIAPDAAMELTAPGVPPLRVPLTPPVRADGAPSGTRGAPVAVVVWGWEGEALDEGEGAAEWLSGVTGQSVRLVCFDFGNIHRPVEKAASGLSMAFGDDAQYLVAGKASIEDLNNHLPAPIPISRFRANIIVSGSSAWQEDRWRAIRISGGGEAGEPVSFSYVKPCARCKVPTFNAETLEFETVVGEALSRVRSGQALGRSAEVAKETFFGTYFVADASNSTTVSGTQQTVSVGDVLEVVQTEE